MVLTILSNFCLSEQFFLATFRLRTHIKHDKVNDFLEKNSIDLCKFLNVSVKMTRWLSLLIHFHEQK